MISFKELFETMNVMNRTSPVRRGNYVHSDKSKKPGDDGGTHNVVDSSGKVVASYKNKLDAIDHANKKDEYKVKSVYEEVELDEAKLPVQHAVNAVTKVLGTKSATNFIMHLKPGTEKHTTWNKVNSALMKQGVKQKHIVDIATHVRPAQYKEEVEIEEAQFWGNKEMAKQANAASGSTTTMRGRDEKGVYTATLVRKKGESEHKEVSRVYDTKEDTESVEEAAKWRHDDLEGKTWRSPDWDDGDLSPSKIKIDRSGKDVDDSGDELTSRPGSWRGKADMAKRMTKKGVPTKSELAFQDNLKMRMRMQKRHGGLTGPKGNLPEQSVAEAQSSKTGIYQTDVFGAKAYHAKCMEPNCKWESKRFDKIKQAQEAAEKHAKGHFKQGVAEGSEQGPEVYYMGRLVGWKTGERDGRILFKPNPSELPDDVGRTLSLPVDKVNVRGEQGVAKGSGDKVHLKTPKHGLADHPGRNTGVGLRTFSQTPEQDRCPKCNSLFKNHYKQGVAEEVEPKYTSRREDPHAYEKHRQAELDKPTPRRTMTDQEKVERAKQMAADLEHIRKKAEQARAVMAMHSKMFGPKKEEVEIDEAKGALTYKPEHAKWGVVPKSSKEFVKFFPKDKEAEARAHAEKTGGTLKKIDQAGRSMREEVENIEELSKSTLGSYVKKANKQVADNAWKAGTAEHPDLLQRGKLRAKAFFKAKSRMAGIDKATDRLAKEETELDESLKTHYQNGYDAQKKGKTRQDNPHREGTPAASMWAKGWEHSSDKREPQKFANEEVESVAEGFADDFLKMAKEKNPNARISTADQRKKEADELAKKRAHLKPAGAGPSGNPRPLGGYDPKSGRSYSEEVDLDEGDELGIRMGSSGPGFNKTPAGKAREVKRKQEHLKGQMKFTKSQGGISGPKGKLPEEVELEESEHLDELSKSTLAKYIRLSSRDASRAAGSRELHKKLGHDQYAKEAEKARKKRQDGIDKATQKLTAEENEAQEKMLSFGEFLSK